MSGNNISYTRENDPQMFLPSDPFPYPFEKDGLKAILKDFLKVVRKHPAYVEPTHAAFRRLCILEGITTERSDDLLRLTGKEIPSYTSVANVFFGIEEAIHNIINGYGLQASEGGRARKKAIAITGAPGAGKSELVNHLQYNIMRKREPIPFLASSPVWSNPLNALFLPKLIAGKKTQRRRDKMMAELIGIIDRLDLSGDSALDFDNPDVIAIATKHGFKAGEKLGPTELAAIVMKSEKDFVAIVCYGLGLEKPTVDALVMPDPWAQDVVLGEFFGPALITDPYLRELAGLEGKPTVGKSKKDAKYGQFDEDYAVDLADFPLDNMYMSEGQGLLDVGEVQPINFDLKVWRGDVDISAMGLYSDRDPRTVSPSGAFNRARFIVLTEGFRNPVEGFRVLLEALEGQRLSLPEPLGNYHQQGLGWEGMIVIHSNDEQWNRFYANPDHRAHLDRVHHVSCPYPLEPKMAAKVSEKLWGISRFSRPAERGGCHREPIIPGYVGSFRAATHIDWKSKANLQFMAVLRAYDGQTVRQPGMGTEIDPRALREQAPWDEGLGGMSPREMDSIIGEMAANARQEFEQGLRVSPCFTTKELRDYMIRRFRRDAKIDKKVADQWIEWLQSPLEKEIRKAELQRIYKAAHIPNFKDLAQNFFARYLEYLKAIARGSVARGASGGYVSMQEMEKFLQEIERADALQINSAQADKFRLNVMVAVRVYNEEHGTTIPPYTVHEGLAHCIEAFVLRQSKDIVGVIGLSNLSEEEKKRLDGVKARLIQEHGFCEHCAQALIVEAALDRNFFDK